MPFQKFRKNPLVAALDGWLFRVIHFWHQSPPLGQPWGRFKWEEDFCGRNLYMALKAENWNGWTCLKINSSRRCSEGVSKYSQVSVGVKTTAIFKTHLVEKKYQWYGHRASSWDYNPIEVVLVCWWNCSVGIYGLRRHSPGALNIKSLWLTSVSVFSRECWWFLNFKIHPGTSTEHFSRKNSLFATPFFLRNRKTLHFLVKMKVLHLTCMRPIQPTFVAVLWWMQVNIPCVEHYGHRHHLPKNSSKTRIISHDMTAVLHFKWAKPWSMH